MLSKFSPLEKQCNLTNTRVNLFIKEAEKKLEAPGTEKKPKQEDSDSIALTLIKKLKEE